MKEYISFGKVKSVDIKSAAHFKQKRKKDWSNKTPRERNVVARKWVWSNEY